MDLQSRAEKFNKSLEEGDLVRTTVEKNVWVNGKIVIVLPKGLIGKITRMSLPDQWGGRRGSVRFESGVMGLDFSFWGGWEKLHPLELLAHAGIEENNDAQ